MKSKYSNFVVVDVETGGLPSKDKRAVYDIALTEVAFVAISQELKITDKLAWLIRPYAENLIYTKQAEEASGISRAMVAEQGMTIEGAVKEMVAFLKKQRDGNVLPVLLGHNFAKFDAEFMVNAFDLCKEDLFKYVNATSEDTIEWARLCWTESTNYKLGTCAERAGVTLVNAHRAMADTVATAEMWIYFMRNLRGLNGSAAQAVTKRFRESFQL